MLRLVRPGVNLLLRRSKALKSLELCRKRLGFYDLTSGTLTHGN